MVSKGQTRDTHPSNGLIIIAAVAFGLVVLLIAFSLLAGIGGPSLLTLLSGISYDSTALVLGILFMVLLLGTSAAALIADISALQGKNGAPRIARWPSVGFILSCLATALVTFALYLSDKPAVLGEGEYSLPPLSMLFLYLGPLVTAIAIPGIIGTVATLKAPRR